MPDLFGARLGLEDAYRFARGEEVMASSGQPARLGRPLDWLVIADHSDGMGFFNDLAAGDPDVLSSTRPNPGTVACRLVERPRPKLRST